MPASAPEVLAAVTVIITKQICMECFGSTDEIGIEFLERLRSVRFLLALSALCVFATLMPTAWSTLKNC